MNKYIFLLLLPLNNLTAAPSDLDGWGSAYIESCHLALHPQLAGKHAPGSKEWQEEFDEWCERPADDPTPPPEYDGQGYVDSRNAGSGR